MPSIWTLTIHTRIHQQVHPVYTHFPVPNPGCGSYFGKLHFAGYHLGEISSYNGIPFFSEDGQAWIRSRTGQQASFPAIWGDIPPWQTRPSADSGLLCKVAEKPIEQIELPDRKIVEQYLSFFISSEFRLAFPLVDPVLFKQTLDLAYAHGQGDRNGLGFEQITAKACVFAFLSVLSLLEVERTQRYPDIPNIDTDMMAAKAQMLLPLTIQALDITSLQASFMLCLYQLFLGQVQSSAMLLALACRIMFMLGGHKLSNASWLPTPGSSSGSGTTTPASAPIDLGDRKRRHLRRLFWLCYSVDTDISLRTGQPPSIDDDHCDLSLPPGYLEIQFLDRRELETLKERHFSSLNSHPNSYPIMPSPSPYPYNQGAGPFGSNNPFKAPGGAPPTAMTSAAQGHGHGFGYPSSEFPYLGLDETSVPALPGDLRLTLIKSKTCKLLYSASALRKSDAELLRDIRELDDELERWRLSVPEWYRPALSLSRTSREAPPPPPPPLRGGDETGTWSSHGSGRASELDERGQGQGGYGQSQQKGHGKSQGYDLSTMSAGESVRTIIINLQYHHLVATIHQATGRCRAWQNRSSVLEESSMGAARTGEMLMEGVSSSLALSVEASRSTLIYLRSVTRALLGEAFWVIILYPMSAVMTIFCSILLNPLDPQAEDDLRLLETAPDLIKGIRIRRLTHTELLHLKTVDEFMGELMRLGGCAIRRAKEEEREREMRDLERRRMGGLGSGG
ncbi:hypothetical protein GE21DRAFT_6931 [Neurospora crassa]|uniref:Xylanolytic transcriptional activator regulatory domain-containing protein n=1 Tax=Neurospora crassa (strain ATCC 24698 / 74-OR23-1A / CBS 708.71 / DSM 1257 / FGSC 987) TaxID=367110 RepID=Q7S1R3_NEUCR|nr:hypothetical protein NCU09829 [Neurospora crassa OR74A]EAA29292.2 hypothetical protein NCU09829 [Neurospora crassa OR74A]KHE84991.1 hypothetical protein GE21DRAFT_6931 [Neurospora crassa]|eukprot:XP_958528.2 hypothetical protein NCU09829 [Neurospora crassa OR74A]